MSKNTACGFFLVASILLAGCASNSKNSGVPNATESNTSQASLDGQDIKGQTATCGNGPNEKTFTIEVFEKTLDLGMGFKTTTWTYGQTTPGPLLETCEGDKVTITLKNNTDVSHGLEIATLLRLMPPNTDTLVLPEFLILLECLCITAPPVPLPIYTSKPAWVEQ